jgi:hypothetical protein
VNHSGRRRYRNYPPRRILNLFNRARERIVQLRLDDVGELLRWFCHGDMRLFARDRDRRRRSRDWLCGFSRSIYGSEMFPDLIGDIVVKRTGMGLLLNPQYVKVLQDEMTLDLQFTRQNIDSYFTHSVFLITLPTFPPLD